MAGVVTHLLVKLGYITTYLKVREEKDNFFSWGNLYKKAQTVFQGQNRNVMSHAAVSCCVTGVQYATASIVCCDEKPKASNSCACTSTVEIKEEMPLGRKIRKESLKSVWMISQFMGLAFLLNALLNLYVPQESVGRLLNQQGFVSVIIAAVLGVPVYTSNLTALPLVSGLLQLGLHPGAALAFLISGPMTTIPAMVAVFGITSRKVFGLYVFFALFGALLFGMLCYFLG